MANDSIQTQKDIFAGIQGLLAFLDTINSPTIKMAFIYLCWLIELFILLLL